MTYQLTTFNTIIRLADNAFIPMDEQNADYRKYLEWLSKGNIPKPAASTPVSTEPDYQTFLDLIIADPLYQKLLAQSTTSPVVNTAFTALMGALILASTGRPNITAIQAGLNDLLTSMTLAEGDVAALQSILSTTKLNNVITLAV